VTDSEASNEPQNRDTSGRFKPGVSGNPGGRPVGLSQLIRSKTDDGNELVEMMLQVFRGELGEDVRARVQAASWLSDRAFGRPRPMSEMPPESAHAYSVDGKDPVEELKAKLDAIRARRIAWAREAEKSK
jgi:hypothetical protein